MAYKRNPTPPHTKCTNLPRSFAQVNQLKYCKTNITYIYIKQNNPPQNPHQTNKTEKTSR